MGKIVHELTRSISTYIGQPGLFRDSTAATNSALLHPFCYDHIVIVLKSFVELYISILESKSCVCLPKIAAMAKFPKYLGLRGKQLDLAIAIIAGLDFL